jgi:hypothetical protein
MLRARAAARDDLPRLADERPRWQFYHPANECEAASSIRHPKQGVQRMKAVQTSLAPAAA